jgi:hypothetical protein
VSRRDRLLPRPGQFHDSGAKWKSNCRLIGRKSSSTNLQMSELYLTNNSFLVWENSPDLS